MRTIEAKIVVLGAQGVGKTSMVVRYVGKMFSHHISPTIGASFFTCKINVENTRVKLQRNVLESMVLSVVGNKTDLEAGRKVTREEALQYATSIGANYFESSALHDEGIEDIFLTTAIGLIRLSQDSLSSSLRIYDSSEPLSTIAGSKGSLLDSIGSSELQSSLQSDCVAHAEVERAPMCC
ncbi:Ras-related protein RabJ [Blattella germanica]|nr:Ras-related protein RabJ [Blattella germanica]